MTKCARCNRYIAEGQEIMKWIDDKKEESFCNMGCYLFQLAFNNKIEVSQYNHNTRYASTCIAYDPRLYDYPTCHVCKEIHFPVLEIDIYDYSRATLICKGCVKRILAMMETKKKD